MQLRGALRRLLQNSSTPIFIFFPPFFSKGKILAWRSSSAVPALSQPRCPWPCCHLQGISHQIPLCGRRSWPAPPRPKAAGTRPTGNFWRTFHSTIQELKKLNRFYILRLQPFSATLKTIYLRGCGCYAGKFSLPQMLGAVMGEACNQQFGAFYGVVAAAAKNARYAPQVEACQ